MCDVVQDPGDDAAADKHHDGEEGDDLQQRDAEGAEDIAADELAGGAIGDEERGEGRKGDQRQHHHEVFDDQPTDGDAALFG